MINVLEGQWESTRYEEECAAI